MVDFKTVAYTANVGIRKNSSKNVKLKKKCILTNYNLLYFIKLRYFQFVTIHLGYCFILH